jgi:hypothetical protein
VKTRFENKKATVPLLLMSGGVISGGPNALAWAVKMLVSVPPLLIRILSFLRLGSAVFERRKKATVPLSLIAGKKEEDPGLSSAILVKLNDTALASPATNKLSIRLINAAPVLAFDNFFMAAEIAILLIPPSFICI